MTVVRISAVSAPLDRPTLLGPALDLVRRALATGLLAERPAIERLDLALVRDIAEEASAAGVGRDAAVGILGRPGSHERLAAFIGRLADALAASPLPDRELRVLAAVFDLDGLARLTGTSAVSLRRYLAGSRTVPDALAERVHWLAMVTGDLLGAYTEVGARRWFERSRTALGGRAPATILSGAWDPDDPSVEAVRQLAAALAGVGGAS